MKPKADFFSFLIGFSLVRSAFLDNQKDFLEKFLGNVEQCRHDETAKEKNHKKQDLITVRHHFRHLRLRSLLRWLLRIEAPTNTRS